MWELIRANRRRATVLVVVMGGLMLAVGYGLGELWLGGGGPAGLVLAFLVWLGMTLVSYFQGDRILLATSGARRLKRDDHPVLWNVVEEMKIASGLPAMPEVYLMDEAAPNAFATGRRPERSAVVVTSGLLEQLDRDELQGVVAHELGHIKNRDVMYMTLVGVMLGTVVMLADLGTRALWYGGGRRRTSSDRDGGVQAVILVASLVLVVLAPFLAQLMYFALSRRREYLADASAALFTRYPEGLARALEKISAKPEKMRRVSRATAPMFIVNPLSSLSRTHPPTAERVRILRSLGGGTVGLLQYDEAFREVTGRAVGVVPAGSIREAEAQAARRSSADPRDHLKRVRDVTDSLWRLQNFGFIACGCGTKLKMPPEYREKKISCPQCGTVHPAGHSPIPPPENL